MIHKLYLTGIFLLLLLLLSGPGYAQIKVTNATFPEDGDTLKTYIDRFPPGSGYITPGGADQQWNFSDLARREYLEQLVGPAAEGQAAALFTDADLFIRLNAFAESYHKVSDQRFENIGYNGLDPIGLGFDLTTRFDKPIVERFAPLDYNDVKSSQFEWKFTVAWDDLPPLLTDTLLKDLPITPDSIRLEVQGDRTHIVDAWGELTIPGGTFEVLREKRLERRDTRIFAILGFIELDVTDLVLSLLGNIGDLGLSNSLSYHFYSETEKEAIASIATDTSGQKAEAIEFKALPITVAVKPPTRKKQPNIQAMPNPVLRDTRFALENLEPGRYTLSIHNFLGAKVWGQDYFISGKRIVYAELDFLPQGPYFYTLVNDKGQRIATKRLIKVGP